MQGMYAFVMHRGRTFLRRSVQLLNTHAVVKSPTFHHSTRCWWLLPARHGKMLIGWLGGPVSAEVEVKDVYTVCATRGEAEYVNGIGKE